MCDVFAVWKSTEINSAIGWDDNLHCGGSEQRPWTRLCMYRFNIRVRTPLPGLSLRYISHFFHRPLNPKSVLIIQQHVEFPHQMVGPAVQPPLRIELL